MISLDIITWFDPWGSRLCTCPRKYSFSPYTGCSHACTYCYISAYIPHPFQLRPKRNLIQRLLRDLVRLNPNFHISIANSSDPYPPEERKFLLTRESLKAILNHGFRVQLITKSDLITRDIDLIKHGNCSVSFTITTLDDKVAERLEPRAPPPSRRLEALRKLANAGIPCSVRIDPLIPYINTYNLEELVRKVADAGAKHIVTSTYKAKGDSFKRVVRAFPEWEEKLRKLYWIAGEIHGRARYLEEGFRYKLLADLKEVVDRFGMTYATCREGFESLKTGVTCDGSHLIPERLRLRSLEGEIPES